MCFRRSANLALPVAVALTTASWAGGQERPVAVWHVHTEPVDCGGDRSFAGEVDMACRAAGGGCRVGDGGSRVAILQCQAEGSWMLELRDTASDEALRVPIEGEDRFASAALAIARVRIPVLEATPPAASAMTVAAPDPRTSSEPPPDRGPQPTAQVNVPAGEKRGGVSVAARALMGSGFDPVVGGRAAVVAGVAFLTVGVAVAGERALSAPDGFAYSAGRLGATLGYGAPWGPAPLGLAIEAGGLYGAISAPAGSTPGSLGFFHPYAQVSILARPGRGDVLRPYAALSMSAQTPAVRVASAGVDVASLPILSAALDFGIACQTW